MKFFTKKELKMISSILFVISVISFFNFRISIRRARDNQRKNDLGTLQIALEGYRNITGSFPLNSPDGKILACKGPDTYFDKETESWINFKSCEWGEDELRVFSEFGDSTFINYLPIDPKNSDGSSFLYLSNGRRYQLLAHLEGTDEAEYDPKIEARGLKCGNKICNYGRSFGSTPLDKSIEEYENELEEQTK